MGQGHQGIRRQTRIGGVRPHNCSVEIATVAVQQSSHPRMSSRHDRALAQSVRSLCFAAAAAAILLGLPVWAATEWVPTKPVRMIVGFPPGGATDLVARMIQPKMSS